ncbi:DUF4181 domain-containing protein [Bacillus sp. CRN 9]|uniref:DUF4181 domain-containing protein n=1 Tax=Cytobacillus horneckiae TaxID=549687 RepID=UPI002AA55216
MILIFIFILILAIVAEHWLRKKYKIDKRKWIIYKGVNTFQRWIEGLLFVAFLIAIMFVDNAPLVLIAFILILTSFRAVMEWKFERSKKEYIITTFSIFIFLLTLGICFYIDIIQLNGLWEE